MHLTALAWMYVVLMMTAVEMASPQGTVLGGLSTLLFYGLLPLGVVLYIMGTPARRRRRQAQETAKLSGDSGQPDAGGHAPPGTAVPAQADPVREKI